MRVSGLSVRGAFKGLLVALDNALRGRLQAVASEVRFRWMQSRAGGRPHCRVIAIVGGTARPMPPTGYGGVETTLYELALALRDRGWTVHMWGSFQRARPELYEGIALHEGTDPTACHILSIHPAVAYLAWPTALQLRRLAKERRRVVIGEFNHPTCFPPRVADTYVRCMNSLFAADALAGGYPADRIIELPYWQAGETRYQPDIPRENWLLWVARPDRTKALEEAFRFAIRTGEELRIYAPWYPGDEAWLQVLERVRPPNVRYCGELTRQEKPDVFSRCRAFLYTADPGYKEAFGLVFLEALHSGTPVLALDHHAGSTQARLFPGPPFGLRAADTDTLIAMWNKFKDDLVPEEVFKRARQLAEPQGVATSMHTTLCELVERHAHGRETDGGAP